jgi:hypothetical protein
MPIWMRTHLISGSNCNVVKLYYLDNKFTRNNKYG